MAPYTNFDPISSMIGTHTHTSASLFTIQCYITYITIGVYNE